MAHGGPLKL
uniref:Uncharacterized protein n=1 Tax=Rhizophora mucronata TaxID=61149 RepID=A0A2P2Q3E6_RHIMU